MKRALHSRHIHHRAYPYIPAMLAVLLSLTVTANVSAQGSGDGMTEEPTDSIEYDIDMISEEEESSFFDGVIPPTPQSAALARYSAYPVGHTTGLPDISIPLYEINMGGFSLPISISYHNAGARCDEIETCVGLGWSLQAGGAVTRTVLGAPDLEYRDAASADYTYYAPANVEGALEPMQSGVIQDLVTGIRDSESDRYTFRAGPYNGVFRFDYSSGSYILLGHSSCKVSSYYSGPSAEFRILCPDNSVYTYTVQEGTGVDRRGEGAPVTTAWYVSLIETPYGCIEFDYYDDIVFSVDQYNRRYRSGTFGRRVDQNGYVHTEFEFKSEKIESKNTVTYRQKLLKSISWNGNRIEFTYDSADVGTSKAYNRRLASMKVVSLSGETVKTVTFGNSIPWLATGAKRARRMLRSISDSQAGIYAFSYHDGIEFPDCTSGYFTNDYSDLWGFWNGTSGSDLTPSLADWLSRDENGVQYNRWLEKSRSRSPSLEPTKAGVLHTVVFPTGGSVSYTYEQNKGIDGICAGLRVKSTSVSDGISTETTDYTYYGIIDTSQNPEDLMHYLAECKLIYPDGLPFIVTHRTVLSSPIGSMFAMSSPVVYTDVEERHSDGSRIECRYNSFEIGHYPTYSDNQPSLFYLSTHDRGGEEPMITKKEVYDSSGKLILTEKTDYETYDFGSFVTGVRFASIFSGLNVADGQEAELYDMYTKNPPGLKIPHCTTYATPHIVVPKEVTVTDHTTGVSTVTSYTYDYPQYRTTQPLSVTVTNSDGTALKTEFEYAFMRTDAVSKEMTSLGLTDTPIVTRRYSGDSLLSVSETEYQESAGYYLPVAYKSWSMPTTSNVSERVVNLMERERISEYNTLGRPLAITVNETDRTELTWGGRGDLLMSSTAPGNLKTSYTHRVLFGPSSVTLPNGHKSQFTYNTAGILEKISDNAGTVETHSYSISNHGTAAMTGYGNSVTTRRWLNAAGSNSVYSRQYHDGLGRPTVSALGGANKSGKYLYSSVTYDTRGRESLTTLAAVGGTSIENLSHASVLALAKTTCADNYPCSETTYDGLDRPVSVSTPGDDWHSAGKAKKTEYVTNAANSVRLYSAPVTSVSLVKNVYYAAGTLSGVRTIDEDGNEMTVYSDRLGRKVLERRGPESGKGKNDTYFVNNALGQLRYVISPEYENEASADKCVYEYRYDSNGLVTWKHIPGAGDTQYWYDRAGRMTFMQDAMLREKGLYRFFVYDTAGRQVIQGTTASCNRSEYVNFATFSGSGGFYSTYYNLSDASRILSPTIETVAYYDGYGFASMTDTRLLPSDVSPASTMGRQTGSVEYCSDGSRSVTSILYDIRGNVLQTREITPDSYLRTTTNTYGYADELLTSTVVENGLTVVTQNTYHAASGLPVSTDVTVNGTSAIVSRLTYDDLGRVTTTSRGSSGETVRYTYNLHNKTTGISGPGFSQVLHYADGPGTKLYNGSISSMTWTMGTDKATRGYAYTYNQYGWLTQAAYGETTTLGSNKDHYTEKITAYSLNGMPKAIQRNGLKADGTYGAIDDLKITLDGNRIAKVYEGANPVTTAGSMDFAGTTGSNSVFAYNSAGALTRDDSRGITSIMYDNLGHPVRINFANGSSTTNVYSPSGVRLKTVSSTPATSLASEFEMEEDSMDSDGIGVVTGSQILTYRGNAVWRNGKVEMVLIPGGYATLADGKESGAPTFHYYTTDYLGNVRAVTNGSTGLTEQLVAYYPLGGIIPTLGGNLSAQPYKFGGKELLTANGLNEYDFGARNYAPMVPAFTSVDPLCEKYYWLSPYLYCANNPVNAVDPNGMDIWDFDQYGHVVSYQHDTEYDIFRIVDKKYNPIEGKTLKMSYGSVKQLPSISVTTSENTTTTSTQFQLIGDQNGIDAFEFLADNTGVEWQHAKTGIEGETAKNYITTTHLKGEEAGMVKLIEDKLDNGINFREVNHNHPSNLEYASGLDNGSGDINFAKWLCSQVKYTPKFNIYISNPHKYIPFSSNSSWEHYTGTYTGIEITIKKNL